MAGATHLQNRLDAADVRHILALRKQGLPVETIALRYKLSPASIHRILSGVWNAKQIAAWGEPQNMEQVLNSTVGHDSDLCGCSLCIGERADKRLRQGMPANTTDTLPEKKPRKRTGLPLHSKQPLDVEALSYSLADLISALQLVRESRQSVLSAGGSRKLVSSLIVENLNE